MGVPSPGKPFICGFMAADADRDADADGYKTTCLLVMSGPTKSHGSAGGCAIGARAPARWSRCATWHAAAAGLLLLVVAPTPPRLGAGAPASSAPAAASAAARAALLESYAAPPAQSGGADPAIDLTLLGDLRRAGLRFGRDHITADPLDGTGLGFEIRTYPSRRGYAAARLQTARLCGPLSRAESGEAGRTGDAARADDASARTLDGSCELGRLLDPPAAWPRLSSRLGLGLWGMTRRIDASELDAAPLTDRWFGPTAAGRVNYAFPPWLFAFADGWCAPVVYHATSGGADRDWGGHAAEIAVGLTVEPLEWLTLDLGYGWADSASGAAGGSRSRNEWEGPFLRLRLLW